MTPWSNMSAYEQLIESVAVKLATQRRGRIRNFGGYADGVRRDLSVATFMARDITSRMTFAYRFRDRDKIATEVELADVVDRLLSAIPADIAFRLTSTNHADRETARHEIAKRIVDGLIGEYEVTKNDITAATTRRGDLHLSSAGKQS